MMIMILNSPSGVLPGLSSCHCDRNDPIYDQVLTLIDAGYLGYGNMGYVEFKEGTKNKKDFVPNMIIFQEEIHILKNE